MAGDIENRLDLVKTWATMIQFTGLAAAPFSGRIDLVIPRAMRLDDDLLFAFCAANRDLRIERNAHGDLEIMAPGSAG